MTGPLERSCVITIIGRPFVGAVEHPNKSTNYFCAAFCTRATTYVATRCKVSDFFSSNSEYDAPSICFSVGYGRIRAKMPYQWTNQLRVCLHYVVPCMWVSHSLVSVASVFWVVCYCHMRGLREEACLWLRLSRVWGRSWGWRNSWASRISHSMANQTAKLR